MRGRAISAAVVASPASGLRAWSWLLGMGAVLVLLFLLRVSAGTVPIPLTQVVGALVDAPPPDPAVATIVRQFRLPHAVTAVLAGAALAVGGLLMQTLFRNPLAGPWIMGVVAGGRVGVALLLVGGAALGWRLSATLGMYASLSLALAAGLGVLVTFLAVLGLSRRVGVVTLLVTGVVLSYVADGLTSLLMHFTDDAQRRVYMAWNEGGFGGVTWTQLKVFVPAVAVGVILAAGLAKSLNALLIGERYAQSAGVPLRAVRVAVVVSMVLLAGSCTAFCGPVVFIDVAVPHLCRGLLQSADHRRLIPMTAMAGAAVALAADLLAALPGLQSTVHVNAVTALFGGPVVLWVLLRRRGAVALSEA